jgi:hypothetical protein
MAIEPAAISEIPATIIRAVELIAPLKPAASAKGTVKPSLIPITMSDKRSELFKCDSWWCKWVSFIKWNIGIKISPAFEAGLIFILEFVMNAE